MRTRKEINQLTEKGLYYLKWFKGLCVTVNILRIDGRITKVEQSFIDREIYRIGNCIENPSRLNPYFLGLSGKNKDFRSYVFILAIEKLYSEGKL